MKIDLRRTTFGPEAKKLSYKQIEAMYGEQAEEVAKHLGIKKETRKKKEESKDSE